MAAPFHFMRARLLWIGLAVLAGCGASVGGTGAVAMGTEAASIDGAWHAYSDGMGSTLALTLATKAGVVSGSGTYSRGALRTGTVRVTGQFRAPTATLQLTYDHGETVTLTATLAGPERMTGRLTDRSGSVVSLEFVRP